MSEISVNEWIESHQERWDNFLNSHKEIYPDMFHVENSSLICNNSIISNSVLESCIIYNTQVINSRLACIDASMSEIRHSTMDAHGNTYRIDHASVLHSSLNGGGVIKIIEQEECQISTNIEYTYLHVSNNAEIVISRSNLIATNLDVYETRLNIEKCSSVWHTNGYITNETTIKKFSRIHKAVIDGGGVISRIITVSGIFVENWMLSIINDEELNVNVSVGCHVMTPKQWERVIEEECRAHGISVARGKAIKTIAQNIVEVITHEEFFE